MDEEKDDGSDLFGALVKRKISASSSLYNTVDLFNLSLPALNENPPEIFSKPLFAGCDTDEPCSRRYKVKTFNAANSIDQPCVIAPVLNTNLCSFQESRVADEQTTNGTTRQYFSLASKHSFSGTLRSGAAMVSSEPSLILATVFALKGVSTNTFNLERLPPKVSILGRSDLSVSNYMRELRSLFVIRALMDCACMAYCNYVTDAGLSALGAQITSLLHIVDASLSQLSAVLSSMPSKITDPGQCASKPLCAQPSLVALWDNTQLHRTLLVHLYSIIRPPELDIATSTYGTFVWDKSVDCNDATIQRYLHPSAWAQLPGGWSLLHALMRQLQSIRTSVWAANPAPIFQIELFRNVKECRAAMAGSGMHRAGGSSIVADFACMIVTGTLARQVSAPLLREISQKLYQLDADFHQAGRIAQAELADSLLISVEALWRSFSLDEVTQQPDSDDGDQSVISAESCAEFLLCALVWARGRIDLMLTEAIASPGSVGSSDPSGRRAQHRNSSADHKDGSVEGEHGRLEWIQAFREIAPDLLLPMNDRDEEYLTGVRRRSEALGDRLRDTLTGQVNTWYQSYATLSDYYNENAVAATSLFVAAADHRLKRDATADENALVLFRKKQSEDDRAREIAARQVSPKPGADSGEVTLSVGPLNTPKSVPRELIEQAKDQIRAKYDSLMRQAEERGAAAAWENRRMETLPQARSKLVQLFEQDEAELRRLRALKNKDAEQYMQHFEDQAAGHQGQTTQAQRSRPPDTSSVHLDNALVASAPSASQEPDRAPPVGPAATISSVDLVTTSKGRAKSEARELRVLTEESAMPGADEVLSADITQEDPLNTKYVNSAPDVDGAAEVNVQQDAQPVGPEVEVRAAAPIPEEATPASHLLQDLAAPLLKPDTQYLDTEEQVYAVLQSLSSAVLLLGKANGLVAAEDESASNGAAAAADSLLGTQDQGAGSSATLHSVHSIFMRSLGRAVLSQCRAINLASAQCLISRPVDLLGHISVVDNLLLVSPNSDFLMSLCTLMVDYHLQQIRVLRRQRTVEALSPHLSKTSNACLWNDESLQLGFTSVLTNASAASEWKAYGTQFAALNIDTVLPSLDTSLPYTDVHTTVASAVWSISQHTESWVHGLFSTDGLERLYACYDAPWPVPVIISRLVLNKFTPITQRFLELGHLVALFRIVWGEQRYSRVLHSGFGIKKKPTASKVTVVQKATEDTEVRRRRVAERRRADRQVSDATRLVQQTVQSLFDHLSERVYVHQARFKQAMCRASSDGLDGVVHALNAYADALSSSALQLTDDETVLLGRRVFTNEGHVGSAADPVVDLKVAINCMLDSCRDVLRWSMLINEASNALSNEEDGTGGEGCGPGALHKLLSQLDRDSGLIKQYRAKLIAAAQLCCKFAQHHVDLESLTMRFEE